MRGALLFYEPPRPTLGSQFDLDFSNTRNDRRQSGYKISNICAWITILLTFMMIFLKTDFLE
ncbi:hypothetical protein CF168_08160 [Shewanella bicestrii]|uniref:Uncharacterized protein n=1 Tax=Shewanella bicestrii TaxID=2018305 RepID=A0A220ULH9_9GAMM|nr:hypothetical protein CF168_08160 [Shewanella bicestrii]